MGFRKLTAGLIMMGLVANVTQAREQLKVVGSSTVYPFASFVAEEFGAVTRFPTPIVESTGTGGGFKLFCADNSLSSPDITNASRRIKLKELQVCHRNGVKNVTEIMFGYDGIVLAQAAGSEGMKLSKREILLALAKKVPNKDGTGLIDNPYTHWNQINAELPNRKITVYGPPISSGTRDAFEEIVLQYQTEEMKVYRDAGLKGYRVIRTDGVYIPSGENDNLIVKKLSKDTSSVGIFGYSFLMENGDMIKSISVDGVEPTIEAIASTEYPISRSLYFYVKNDHIKDVPSIKEYVQMFMSSDIVGSDGLLTEIGLIPLNSQQLASNKATFSELKIINTKDLNVH